MALKNFAATFLGCVAWAAGPAAAAAEPKAKAIGLQPAATEIAQQMHWFHNSLLMPIITVISALVLVLLAIIILRFNRRANPQPSKTTHNTALEIVWTAVPVIILIVIAVFSFPLLTLEDETPAADMTIKATGNQWNWTYEYPDYGDFSFTAVLVPEEELQAGQKRLLETDLHVVVPAGKVVKVLVTASDVLHSWAVPAFGIKIDGVPGRLNETWFKVDEEGTYYGQCSELCGRDHGFMPIVVEVVSQEKFDAWVAEAQDRYADAAPSRPVRLALAN